MGMTKDMTKGPITRQLLLFALPLMLGNVFQQLYAVVDTGIVGQALGVNALAAVGATDWINWFDLMLYEGIAQGFGILIAQYFGAKQYDKMKKSCGNAMVLALLSVIALEIGFQLSTVPLLRLMQTPEVLLPMASLYLRIIFAGIPLAMAYNMFAVTLRALGDSKSPLLAMVVASIVNIGLDSLFIFGLGLGIGSAAAATIIGQGISALICFIKLRKIDLLDLHREDFKLEGNYVKRLWGLAIPVVFSNVVIAVGGMVLQSAVNRISVVFIAGFTAANKLYGIFEIAAISYGFAMQTFIGQNFGAENYARIHKGTLKGIILAVATAVLVAILMFLFGHEIVGLFISGSPDQEAQALSYGVLYLYIMSAFLPVLYIIYVVKSVFQAIGASRIVMWSGVVELFARVFGAFSFPIFFGEKGLFGVESLAWIAADILLIIGYIWWYNSIKKKQKNGAL